MLASPPPSTDVKSDHRFQSAALVQHHQHLSTSLAHRAPYDLYHHSTHEPEVHNSEFNWGCSNSNLKLPTFNLQSPYHHAGMEKKTNSNSPQTPGPALTAPLPAINNSVSPPPLVEGKCQSDGRTSTHENCFAGRHAMQTEREAGESRPLSTKRPRPPSLSQLDVRCFERYPYSVLVASGHTSPSGYSPYGSGAVTKEEDAHSLPPIVTREEREQDVCSGDIKPIVHLPAANYAERQQPQSAADSDEMLENSSSSQKPTDTNSNQSPQLDRQFSHSPRVITNQPSVQLSTSSETVTLAPEPYPPSQQNQPHAAPATPHSATSVSFNSHQQLPQPTSFSNHSNGYFSALPSPVAPHANAQHALPQHASYPGSPTMTMTAPSSATFAPDTTPSFGPISPQLSSAAGQHHHLAPSASPLYRSSATAFPHTAAAHLIGSSYPTSGAAQGVSGPSPSSTRATAVSSSVSSTVPAPSASQWGTTENQPPRRRGKLPQGVTNILRTWLMAHTGHPYPTEEEKKTLCEQTQLSINQVSNWFINARRRILVPPSGGSSVHEIRQPVRRQAQSQLVRAAANAGITPPGLPLHHLTPQPIGGSLTSPTMFSPPSGASSNMSGGGAFEFRYALSHHPQPHEPTFHNNGLPACRLSNPLTSSHGQWTNSAHHAVRPTLNSSTYSGVSGQNSGSVPYYHPSHSPYSHYSAGHSTFSTPLPSPHYPPPYSGCPPHYPAQPRLHSPCSHPDSHPSTPTIAHSHSHPTTATYVSQPSGTQSVNYPSTPDRELK